MALQAPSCGYGGQPGLTITSLVFRGIHIFKGWVFSFCFFLFSLGVFF